MRANPVTQTTITLNWTKAALALRYEVNGGALTAWTNAGDVALYQFTGLTANTQYTLQVRAFVTQASAAASVMVKTLPNAPTSPTTSDISGNSIKLSWTASVGGADSYEVSSDGSTWVDSGSDTEHIFTGLTVNTAYTLWVRAKNISGVSAAVSAAS
ncbi:MAG: fibronectin type III domain-containing protein, partial [Chloroflexota bacterium]|nr:fibronectin type III domain-containing protein [Chloroflexota bacterium]